MNKKQSAIVDAAAYLERHDVMVIQDGKPRFLHELVRAELAAKDEALRMAHRFIARTGWKYVKERRTLLCVSCNRNSKEGHAGDCGLAMTLAAIEKVLP